MINDRAQVSNQLSNRVAQCLNLVMCMHEAVRGVHKKAIGFVCVQLVVDPHGRGGIYGR